MTRARRDPLELVSLRQLRYFGAAVQASSFSQAAKACAISQPALSEQISALESTLGLQLFDRIGRRAVPTQPALQLQQRLSACMGDLQAALRSSSERAQVVSGRVRIGLAQSYAACWVTPVVRAAQRRWPALSVSLSRRTASALLEGVVRGDFDLAVTFDPSPVGDVEILPCFTEPFVAIGMTKRRRPVTLQELARERLALLPTEYAMRRQIDALFSNVGLSPKVQFESDAFEDLVHAAREDGLTAVVNAATALNLHIRGAVPIDAPSLVRTASLVRSRSRYQVRAAGYLWDQLAEQAATLKARLA